MLRPMVLGKNRRHEILPEPNRKTVFLQMGVSGKDLKELLQKEVERKAKEKMIERQMKIEKIKMRLYDTRTI